MQQTNQTMDAIFAQSDAADGGPMVEMQNVAKTFENAAGVFTALNGVNLTLPRGEFISVVGKSGSGKSTLLNMITGIDHPTSGNVIVGGQDIYSGVSESERSKWRGRNLGIVFQFFQLLPTLTLQENVMLSMDFADMYSFESRPERAMNLLKLVGLEEFAYKQPAFVSTGQQQLTAIARALACDPPFLVADEPTGNLDSKSAELIISLFEELAGRGKTVLIVTHDPALADRSTKKVIISDGEVINEMIARALHWLEHPHMLALTKLAEVQHFTAGETISQGEERFYIVQQGQVDLLKRGKATEQIEPAGMFGAADLLPADVRKLVGRAGSSGPVEVLAFKAAEINNILEQSVFAAQQIEG